MRVSCRRILVMAGAVAVFIALGQKGWTQGERPEKQPSSVAADSSTAASRLDNDLWSALTPLDRQILEFVNESQLEELLNGIDPADIYLSNGETLSALAARTQAETTRNLLFAPVRPCRLIDTRLTGEGRVRRGETRGFRVSEGEDGYAEQGGAAEGCGLPGLGGMTLKTNSVRAVALNVQTVEAEGPGSLVIWPANRSEPEIGSVSFGGGGLAGGLLVPVCDEAGLDPCSGGDLKVKAKISGAHMVADVVGYFHAAGAGSLVADGMEVNSDDLGVDSGASPGSADRDSSADLRATAARAPLPVRSSAPVSNIRSRTEPTPIQGEAPLGGIPDPLAASMWDSAIRGELTTGHGVGWVFDAYLENDGGFYNAAAYKAIANTGMGVWSTANNGRAIYGQTQDGYAVYGFDGGSKANRGYGGYFYSTNGIGVYGYSGANRTHPNILAPGLYGQSNQGVGVYGRGDTSNSHTFFNEGGFFEGGKGLYARGTDPFGEQGYGARIFAADYRGMYVQGATGWFDAYFGGDTGISTFGITNRSGAALTLAVNKGIVPIESGDLVAIAGVAQSPENGQPMLAVAKLDGSNHAAVVGVAKEAFSAKVLSEPDGREYTDFSPLQGVAAANGYLTIVTQGLAPRVNLGSLGPAAAVRIGDKIALSAAGAMELASSTSDAVTIGRVVSPPDAATGTVAIFVDID